MNSAVLVACGEMDAQAAVSPCVMQAAVAMAAVSSLVDLDRAHVICTSLGVSAARASIPFCTACSRLRAALRGGVSVDAVVR